MAKRTSWAFVQRQIDKCQICCEQQVPYVEVPAASKRHPTWAPKQPNKLMFVSVAPPWGGDYFWDEQRPDRVRDGLFGAIQLATGESIQTTRQFWQAGYYLVPAVKCPSQKDDRDRQPNSAAIANCCQHLRAEIDTVSPTRIVALGQKPLRALSQIYDLSPPTNLRECRGQTWQVPGPRILAATFFPGNNRHRQYDSIVSTIKDILALSIG